MTDTTVPNLRDILPENQQPGSGTGDYQAVSQSIWSGNAIGKLSQYTGTAEAQPMTIIDTGAQPRSDRTGLALEGRDAHTRIGETPEQRIRHLENTYNVRIARDGDTVPGPSLDTVKARTPNMQELAGLEAALQQSQPGTNDQDSKPVNIVFADGVQRGVGVRDGNNIFIFPDGSPNMPATIADAQARRDAQGLSDLPTSIQHIAMHMLAQRGQERLGNDDATVDALARDIGYDVRTTDNIFNPQEYRVRGNDGHLYQRARDIDGRTSWVRMNANGDYVDAQGNVSNYPDAERLSNAQMRERALVKPITNNFASPLQMMAESTTFFRGNERSRLELLHRSPDLYHATKANDQREIDRIHGTKNGNSLMIRMPDGQLALNTMANRTTVTDFEMQRPPLRR